MEGPTGDGDGTEHKGVSGYNQKDWKGRQVKLSLVTAGKDLPSNLNN